MRRETRLVASHRPYAVDLGSLQVEPPRPPGRSRWCRIDAVWFRRRGGVTIACIGHLRDLQHPPPRDAAEFLTRYADGRYGGHCEGRWDGRGYWGAEEPEIAAAHLQVLRPMLDSYPDAPAGYDGWWRF